MSRNSFTASGKCWSDSSSYICGKWSKTLEVNLNMKKEKNMFYKLCVTTNKTEGWRVWCISLKSIFSNVWIALKPSLFVFGDLKLTNNESDLDTQCPSVTLLHKTRQISLQISARQCWFLLQRLRLHDHTSSAKDPHSFSLSQSLKIHLQNKKREENSASDGVSLLWVHFLWTSYINKEENNKRTKRGALGERHFLSFEHRELSKGASFVFINRVHALRNEMKLFCWKGWFMLCTKCFAQWDQTSKWSL